MQSPTPDARGDDPDIPVLTDRVELTPAGGNEEAPAPPVSAGEEDALRRRIVSEVVAAVQERLAYELEDRLRAHLVAEVHSFVTAAMAELQQDIANTVGDAVNDALARRRPPP